MDFMTYIQNLRRLRHEKAQETMNRIASIKTLPYVYSLFAISLSSGMNVEQTLRTVSEYVPQYHRRPIKDTIREIDMGSTFSSSIHHMEANILLRPLSHVMLETYDLGSDSVWVIDSLSKEALSSIKRETEIAIKRLPITMLLPLVLCILPAFVLLSVLPTFINGVLSIDWQ